MSGAKNAIGVRDEGPGDAPAVLLFHGAGATKESNWDSLSHALRRQAERETKGHRFRLIAIDLPGSGDTPLDGPLSLEAIAGRADVVLDERSVSAVHVVGYSLGGSLAGYFAATRPSRVRGITALAPLAFTDARAHLEFDLWRRLFPVDRELWVRLALLTGTGPETFARTPPDVVASWVTAFAASTPAGLPAQAELLTRVDVRPELRKIRVPARVVGFTFDEQVPPAQARAFASDIPGAEYRERPWGHLAPWHEPEAFAREIIEHLVSVAGGAQ